MTVGLLWSKNADFRPNSGHALFQIFPKTGPLNFENCPKTGQLENFHKTGQSKIENFPKTGLIFILSYHNLKKSPNSGTNFGHFRKKILIILVSFEKLP